MAGRKRSSDVPLTAKITKYFCSEDPSGSYNAVFDSSTETERPEESESAESTPSSESVASTCESQSEAVYDLGQIIKSSMDSTEICRAVSKLTDGQRYKFLKEHYRPGTDFKFPKTFSNGCYRSFQYRWLEKHPWLVYRKEADGGFCKFCALFSKNRESLGVLVNKLFSVWVKVHKVVEGHVSNNYNFHAVRDALDFKCSIEQPERNIDVRISSDLFERIQENRTTVPSVFCTVADSVLPSEEIMRRLISLETPETF